MNNQTRPRRSRQVRGTRARNAVRVSLREHRHSRAERGQIEFAQASAAYEQRRRRACAEPVMLPWLRKMGRASGFMSGKGRDDG